MLRSSDIPEVKNLTLFAHMSESNFDKLIQAAYLQTFPAQMDLIAEGDQADFLHVVIEGGVELFATSNGRETIMAVAHPVSTFILAAVLMDAVYLMAARTCQRSRILLIPAEDIRSALDQDEAFARAIVRDLATDYRDMVKHHKNIKLRTAVERVANQLLRYHREQDEAGSVVLPYDKRTLASLLGMTPENLSRALNTLKAYGVEVDGAKVELADIESLKTLAKPNSLIDDHKI